MIFVQTTEEIEQWIYFVPRYVSLPLPEHGLGERGVHLKSSHYLTLGSTGSGKLLTSAAHQLIGWPHDLVAITPKEDVCNLSLGRRTDPALFDSPDLVRRWGQRLGVDPRGITNTLYHLPGGRSMNIDNSGSTAYAPNRYTFLSDVDVHGPDAMSHLMAISRGLFPDQKANASGDPYWQFGPQGIFAAGCGHVLTTESDVRNQNLVFTTQRLLGLDPATGQANPKNQDRLFREMMCNPQLGGFIAAQGAELFNLGQRTLGPMMSTIGTRTRWMLSDSRIKYILSGPSDFSIGELGFGGSPLSVYVTPSRGDKSCEAFLRMFLELSVLMFQKRTEEATKPVLILADEVPSWGEEQIDMLRRALNILRDKKIVCWLYGQSYSQFVNLVGEEGAAEMLSATTLQVFGARDKLTVEMLRERLGRTTIKRRKKLFGESEKEEVYVADTDAIYDELSPASPLQYVIPYAGRPHRLYRPGFISAHTSEGLNVRGLNYDGHFDTGLKPYHWQP